VHAEPRAREAGERVVGVVLPVAVPLPSLRLANEQATLSFS